MLKDVKRISFCSSHYWPTVAVASSRGGALEHRASLSFFLVLTEFYAAATRGPSTLTHFGLASPRSFIAEKSQVLFYLVFCIYLEAGIDF